MTERDAKMIGSKQGFISVGLGLLIAQLIMTAMISSDKGFFKAFFWFTTIDYKLNIFVGAFIMLVCGHFYGQLAGKAILIKNRNFILVGFLCGMAVLLTTAFLAGWTGFIQEGIDNIGTNDNPFEDYIFKPLFWVTIFGAIPAFIVGIWFGRQIKVKGRKLDKMYSTQQQL
ncbi:hypothetical protein [Hymenobacter sp.]|jgi:hypothetical protein|uniref:hypothetical protein n=1 Tax=Hymenobacter sp. TaxID=1898978 RepID=UPI002ED80606